MNTAGVESSKANTSINKDIKLVSSVDNKESSLSNIQKLKEKLSKEQLQNSFEFEDVDVIPAFEKCEGVKKKEAMSCFNVQMMKHIQQNFRYPQDAVINKVEGNVWVRFVIDELGNVTNLKTLAPKNGELLKQEAERVVSRLSSFVPAKKGGKNVLVKYGFPINFSLED